MLLNFGVLGIFSAKENSQNNQMKITQADTCIALRIDQKNSREKIKQSFLLLY
jgi:hypothetical protein